MKTVAIIYIAVLALLGIFAGPFICSMERLGWAFDDLHTAARKAITALTNLKEKHD